MSRRVLLVATAATGALAVLLVGLAVWLASGRGLDLSPSAQIGGPFRLVDQTGRTVTEADLKGHPTALFFGYTHCPDACPTTLSELTELMRKLGPAADRLAVVFVTVDPERDTPEVLADYAKAFDPRFRLLTGTPEQIAQVLRDYRVYAQKVKDENGNTLFNHTASVYLLDAQGRFVGTLAYQEQEDTALAKLRRLLAA